MRLICKNRGAEGTFLIYDKDIGKSLALVTIVDWMPTLVNATVVPDLTVDEAKAINQLLKKQGIDSILKNNNFVSLNIDEKEGEQIRKVSFYLAGWKMAFAEGQGEMFYVTIDKEFERFKDIVKERLCEIEGCKKVVFSE